MNIHFEIDLCFHHFELNDNFQICFHIKGIKFESENIAFAVNIKYLYIHNDLDDNFLCVLLELVQT